MAKKPKVWRGVYGTAAGLPCVYREVLKGTTNCTVIPDGATVPLPTSVRRELAAARKGIKLLRELLASQRDQDSEYSINTNAGCAIVEVLNAHERAMAKRGKHAR